MDGQRALVLLFDGNAATGPGYHHLSELAGHVAAGHGAQASVWLVVPKEQRPGQLAPGCPVLLDPGGVLHTAFGAQAECAYVIRPDGHIGYRAQPLVNGGLLGYLQQLAAT